MIKKYKIEIIIFTTALLLRLLFAFFAYIPEDSNSKQIIDTKVPFNCPDGYYEIAYNLIHHKIFSYKFNPAVIDSGRTPGYPMIMASSLYIFDSLWPFFLLQIIISSLLPLLGRKIIFEITKNIFVANFAACLLVIEPVGIWLSATGLTETFFTFFFLLAVLFILKFIKISQDDDISTRFGFKIIILAAIFLGIATLIKPTTFYFPAILIISWGIYRYFSKQKLLLKQAVVFLAVFIFIISPWLYRNYKVFGIASISSIKEDILFTALVPSVLTLKNNHNYTKSQEIFFASEGIDGYPIVNLDKASWFQQRAVETLKKYPKELIIVSSVSIFTFFTHDGMLGFLGSLGVAKTTDLTARQILAQPPSEMFGTFRELFFSPVFFIIFARVFWILIALLFFLAVGRDFIKKKFTALSAFAFICVSYFALTTIANGYAVNARFRFPVNVFIFMFAINFFYDIINFYKRKTFNSKII